MALRRKRAGKTGLEVAGVGEGVVETGLPLPLNEAGLKIKNVRDAVGDIKRIRMDYRQINPYHQHMLVS